MQRRTFGERLALGGVLLGLFAFGSMLGAYILYAYFILFVLRS